MRGGGAAAEGARRGIALDAFFFRFVFQPSEFRLIQLLADTCRNVANGQEKFDRREMKAVRGKAGTSV